MTSATKRTLLFGAGFGLLLVALTIVSRTTRPPALPTDADHAALSTNLDCVRCHAKGARSPLKPGHPPKDDCLHCHPRVAR